MSNVLPKTLTHYQRVKRVMAGESVDRLPKGEVFFPIGFLEKLTGEKLSDFFPWVKKGLSILDADFVALPFASQDGVQVAAPVSIEEITLWTDLTDYFVFAAVPGVFWPVVREIGIIERASRLALKDPRQYLRIARSVADDSANLAVRCVEAGAHGIIILDDLAGQNGLLFSPQVLRQLVLPFLKEMVSRIKELGVPVWFHSDGDVSLITDDIVGLGVDGIHGLSSQDLNVIRDAYPHITLAGTVDISRLEQLGGDDEIKRVVDDLIAASEKGPVVLGTDGGLTDESSTGILRLIYEKATQHHFSAS